MNYSHMFYEGKVLGMTDDGLMAYSSLTFGLFAAYQWRREARISAWIGFATISSYAEHLLRYEMLTWLDRVAAVSLAIVLVRRVGFIPLGSRAGATSPWRRSSGRRATSSTAICRARST